LAQAISVQGSTTSRVWFLNLEPRRLNDVVRTGSLSLCGLYDIAGLWR
jgi:hypothetical protein